MDKVYETTGRERPVASVKELVKDILGHDVYFAKVIWTRDLVKILSENGEEADKRPAPLGKR